MFEPVFADKTNVFSEHVVAIQRNLAPNTILWSLLAIAMALCGSIALAQVSEPPLTDAAVNKLLAGFDESEPFDGGRYSKVGSAAVYVASTKKIPNFNRLNWVIVRVLSEKYGCFIKTKVNIGAETRYGCRDERTIVFKRYKNKNWMVFHSRQFDDLGRELIVDNHRVLGYGERSLVDDPAH